MPLRPRASRPAIRLRFVAAALALGMLASGCTRAADVRLSDEGGGAKKPATEAAGLDVVL